MWQLLSKILLGLTVALIIPTVLVLVSQNSVPGDSTYPVKRALESVIIKLASVNPSTQAFFNVDFSQRRYIEAVALIKRGDSADQSLQELVTQTEEAATSIAEVGDPAAKQKLVVDLSAQIDEYKKGLVGLEQIPTPGQSLAAAPTQTLVNTVTLPPQSTAGTSGQASPAQPTTIQAPTTAATLPIPTTPAETPSQPAQSTPQPTKNPSATSAPQPTPTPAVVVPPARSSGNIQHTIDELERIRNRLAQQQEDPKSESDNSDRGNKNKKGRK